MCGPGGKTVFNMQLQNYNTATEHFAMHENTLQHFQMGGGGTCPLPLPKPAGAHAYA